MSRVAIIGGTGLYALEALSGAREETVDTRYGEPSAPIVMGSWHGQDVAFLSRHGPTHQIAPHRVNYRANVDALRTLGCTTAIAVNAVGGIRADLGPGVLHLPDQLIDYTSGRLSSFSDFVGCAVEHIDLSEPYSAPLRQSLLAAAATAAIAMIDGGVYGCTQGPRLETRAEIVRLKRDGCDIVGMTGMPEAALAREAGMQYASIAVIANWAAGLGDSEEIALDEIFAILRTGMGHVSQLLAAWLQQQSRAIGANQQPGAATPSA